MLSKLNIIKPDFNFLIITFIQFKKLIQNVFYCLNSFSSNYLFKYINLIKYFEIGKILAVFSFITLG